MEWGCFRRFAAPDDSFDDVAVQAAGHMSRALCCSQDRDGAANFSLQDAWGQAEISMDLSDFII